MVPSGTISQPSTFWNPGTNNVDYFTDYFGNFNVSAYPLFDVTFIIGGITYGPYTYIVRSLPQGSTNVTPGYIALNSNNITGTNYLQISWTTNDSVDISSILLLSGPGDSIFIHSQ